MEGITEIDIVILSYAQNLRLKAITEQCLDSLIASEDPDKIRFNILVMESEKSTEPYPHKNTTTIYPEKEFGYNIYMNMGIALSSSKYICLCNNDLIFHQNWATEILNVFDKCYHLSSASPISSSHHTRLGFGINTGVYMGYRTRYEVAGWCLFFKRDILRVMGKLDENYKFWCADNDFAYMLSTLRIGHALVSSSIVDHLESSTISEEIQNMEDTITDNEFFYFEKKWNSRNPRFYDYEC